MGYDTSFKGRFSCYRADNKQMRAFLQAVYDEDRAALAALADWLIDQGDPRGEQLAGLVAKKAKSLAKVWPPFAMKPEYAAYLKQFCATRRMKRDPKKAEKRRDPIRIAAGLPIGADGAYFVGGEGFGGQDEDASVLDANKPPKGQPGLWCHWVPYESGISIVWDQGEKFYYYDKWLKYIIKHFLAPWGYVLNGEVTWHGEERGDRGTLHVFENEVEVDTLFG